MAQEDRWTLVQKKTTQKLQTDCNSREDAVDTPAAQRGDSKLQEYESSATGVSECQGTVLATSAHVTPVKQTSIESLIGMPFIIQSYQDIESKADGNLNGTRKLKSDDFRKSSSVRGLLRIDPNNLNHETVLESNGQEVRDMSEMNEVDWPSISGYHNMKEDYCENVTDTKDSKSWSTVLRTVSLPQPIRKDKSKAKSSDHSGESGGKGDKKSTSKQKGKKENGHSSTATEKRRDQPLLLEFESLFESLQVQGSKKIVTSGGGGAPVLLSKPATKVDTQHKEVSRRGNILDSSAPATRRGKERETPKKKRPSALRKVITSEKEKRKAREAHVDGEVSFPGTEPTTAVKVKDKPTIHNRRFREYCNHIVKEEINICVEHLLGDLTRFQDRMYLKDPIKAKAKRRYVCGLREVLKHLKLKKLKCIILPPNLDRIQSEGGINDIIGQILDLCSEQQLSLVFAMSRRRLALVLKKRHKVGCVGIFSYDGAESHYKQLMTLVETARAEYDAKVATMDAGNEPHGDGMMVEEDSDVVEAGVPSGSSCESSGSEVEDDATRQQQTIMSTPWRIFFEQSKTEKDESVKPNDSTPLNVNATEFTPTFTFNVDAKEFVPVSFCEQ